MSDDQFKGWLTRWKVAHDRNEDGEEGRILMSSCNPTVIPRNHLVEEAIGSAVNGNMQAFDQLLKDVSKPYEDREDVQLVPVGYDQRYQTFCGT